MNKFRIIIMHHQYKNYNYRADFIVRVICTLYYLYKFHNFFGLLPFVNRHSTYSRQVSNAQQAAAYRITKVSAMQLQVNTTYVVHIL